MVISVPVAAMFAVLAGFAVGSCKDSSHYAAE